MKKIIIFVFIVVSVFTFVNTNVSAKSISGPILVMDKDISGWTKDYDQDVTCEGDNSILGNPEDENSVAWLLNKVLRYSTIIGMLLVIVLSTIDFVSVIISGSDEAMAKAWKKFGMRLLLAALLFFVPTITNALLDLFGFTSQSTCGIEQ